MRSYQAFWKGMTLFSVSACGCDIDARSRPARRDAQAPRRPLSPPGLCPRAAGGWARARGQRGGGGRRGQRVPAQGARVLMRLPQGDPPVPLSPFLKLGPEGSPEAPKRLTPMPVPGLAPLSPDSTG